MKVLMLNGSPRSGGNTAAALHEMERIFQSEAVETELIQVGAQQIRGCVACGGCAKLGRCVFDDAVNELAPKFEASDGLVVGARCTTPRPTLPWLRCSPGFFTARLSTKP